jgi:hypothetical protein
MLSSCAFGLNNFAGKWQALAAADLAAQPLVNAFGMSGTRTDGIADFSFAQRIADAHNHHVLLMRIN